eukprot:TRINITY_DN64420_c0_g1_i1.p1 TRINITY_DN64420_c0_g1~~TRINITY_DN64420_c0_g1_i1.p1  ORF type:complete len:813 (+),score=163.31 TRINITY_DN64420_c0_g1_i1:32-2470(+)
MSSSRASTRGSLTPRAVTPGPSTPRAAFGRGAAIPRPSALAAALRPSTADQVRKARGSTLEVAVPASNRLAQTGGALAFGGSTKNADVEAVKTTLAERDGVVISIAGFFEENGILSMDAQKSWAVAAALGHPLSKSRHTEDKHGSLSTRQQLMNSQFSLEKARNLVKDQIQNTLARQEKMSRGTTDLQRMRHLLLVFAPLVEPPSELVFKRHLSYLRIEDEPDDKKASKDEDEEKLSRSKKAMRSARQKLKTAKLTAAIARAANGNAETEGGNNSDAEEKKKESQEKSDSEQGKEVEKVNKAGSYQRRGTVIATGKVGGGGMTNEQRAMLLTVFKRCIVRVTSKESRSALMQRSTWFFFLCQCDLIGPSNSWDRKDVKAMRVTWMSASKIFKVFAETSSDAPVLTFSGWASAVQAVLRASNLIDSPQDIIKVLFETYLPRIEAKLGITSEDARKQLMMQGSEDGGSRRQSTASTGSTRKSVSRSGRASMAARNTVTSPSGMSLQRGDTRAMSFFSSAGSVFSANSGEDFDNSWNDYGKTPLVWQVNQAEEQMCDPECLQLLHEYRAHLEVLFMYYTARPAEHIYDPESPRKARAFDEQQVDLAWVQQGVPEEMTPLHFKSMLKELRFFPDFVQSFSLERHMFLNEQRHATSYLNFNIFVESLCRISFCYLATYGNIAQQAMPPKYKMLWMLAMMEARLPLHLQKLATQVSKTSDNSSGESSFDGIVFEDHPPRTSSSWWNESPKGIESLWHRYDKTFVISDCPNQDIILAPMIWESCTEYRRTTTQQSLMSEDVDRMLSDMPRTDTADLLAL